MDEPKKDCEVCERLIKEKHRNDFVWKIACIIFLALAVIFAILYFSDGAFTTETTIEIGSNNDMGNFVSGDGEISGDSNVVVGGGEAYSGTIETHDYTPIICISVIAAAAIIVSGVTIIAVHYKKDN